MDEKPEVHIQSSASNKVGSYPRSYGFRIEDLKEEIGRKQENISNLKFHYPIKLT